MNRFQTKATVIKIIKATVLLFVTQQVIYVAACTAASVGRIKDVEFGYYGPFNIAKHAMQKCHCAKKIEYQYVNRDLLLEEFQFRVTTESGRVIGLFFDGSMMDTYQVCYEPAGISILASASEKPERYSPEFLSELLQHKGVQVRNLNDILCHIDQLEEIFRTTQGDQRAARENDVYVWDYLRIHFPNEKELKDEFLDIRDKDLEDWT
jgi:hypothetical protein